MRAALWGFMFCLASVATARGQEPQLGQTRADVVSLLGQPSAIYSPRFSKFYETADRDLALSSAGFVSDIYSRYYSGVEFSLSIAYWLDDSSSRLHPTERVTGITLTPDKDQPFIQTALLLPYTKQMCVNGCKLLGTLEAFSYEVYIYPKIVSPEQLSSSASVASHFNKAAPSKTHWIPCLKVNFREKAGYNDRTLPTFNSLSVDTIELTIFDPDSIRNGFRQPVKELEWNP